MKTLLKSAPPNELTRFAAAFPAEDWDNDFRNYSAAPNQPGHDYREIKKRLIADQGGLCAYCERRIAGLSVDQQKVEHIHPKSDKSNAALNWGLMWTNIVAVCTGGEHDNKSLHPLPRNLSCDSHKNHWLSKAARTPQLAAMLAALINPLQLAPFPCLFDFDKADGRLFPNEDLCAQVDAAAALAPGTTREGLTVTIETALNLNCDRLRTERKLVLNEYNHAVAEARRRNDIHFKTKLAARWFGSRWPSYFTTRRILLGGAAEQYLRGIAYRG
ncbi:MAG: retron system putative HNH endonuclease [Pseudomonadota bacterium]